MAIKPFLKKVKNDSGAEIDAFIVEFTNGNLEQLDELAVFLDKEGLELPKEDLERKLAVIKIGIAWLESLKDKDREKTN